MGMAVLGKGSQGDQVKNLQIQLSNAGFDPGPIDGVFGDMTGAAVGSFQQANNLTVDGVVGPQTMGALASYPSTLSPMPSPQIPSMGVVSAAPITPGAPPMATGLVQQPTITPTPPSVGLTGMPAVTPGTPPPAIGISKPSPIGPPTPPSMGLVNMPITTPAPPPAVVQQPTTLSQPNTLMAGSQPLTQGQSLVNNNVINKSLTTVPEQAQANMGQPMTQGMSQGVSQGTSLPAFNPPNMGDYQSPYAGQIQQILDDMMNTPAYQSPFAAQIQQLVDKVVNRSFSYDASTDEAFQQDSKVLAKQVMELMNSRGILNSTITENQIQQGIAELLPRYREMAYSRYLDEGNQLMQQANFLLGLDESGYNRYMDEYTKKQNMASFIMQMDDSQYARYRDARDFAYQQYQDQYNAAINEINFEREKVQDAWERTRQLGFVDQESSLILGIPAGTLSKDAREAKEQRAQELEDRKAAWDMENSMQQKAFELDKEMALFRERLNQQSQGTPTQLKNYNDLVAEYTANPDTVYSFLQYVISNPGRYTETLGEPLYNKLIETLATVSDLNNTGASVDAVYKEAANRQSNIDDEAAVAYIVNSGLSEPDQLTVINRLNIDLDSL